MAITKAVEAVTDWTAVAQNAVGESATIDCSGNYGTEIHIQAFLDSTTAHTGTKFIVQISSNSSGDEDWQTLTEFVGLIGTAATDLIEDNPLAASSTTITLTSHSLTTLGKWLAIEDGTLANSELVFEVAQATDSITILDGTTNSHTQNTAIYDIAEPFQPVVLPFATQRARVVVDNTYDADGSSLNYKVRVTKVTAV